MDNTLALSSLTADATVPSAFAGTLSGEFSRLTPRDRRLLDLLAEHQTLTTEQITALAFTSERRARRRLLQLHQRQVVDRFRALVRPGSQSWRWTLGPIGAAVVAAATERPIPRPSALRATTARLATSPRLHHLLEVNQFFCALAAYARHHPEAMLLRWWSEKGAAGATGGLVRPDGAGLWGEAGRRVPFWLELDRGTEPLARLAGKLGGYRRLAGTGLAWPVLFWLPNRARENNLHQVLDKAQAARQVTVATAAADNPDAHPAGRFWRLTGHPETWLALHEIPTNSDLEGMWHA